MKICAMLMQQFQHFKIMMFDSVVHSGASQLVLIIRLSALLEKELNQRHVVILN